MDVSQQAAKLKILNYIRLLWAPQRLIKSSQWSDCAQQQPVAPLSSTILKLIVSVPCFPQLTWKSTFTFTLMCKMQQRGIPADPFITTLRGCQKPCTASFWHILKGSAWLLHWSWPVVLPADSFMYVDKQALSCQTRQLSGTHTEPQHLSAWWAEKRGNNCQSEHLCGRRCFFKFKYGLQ